jgi:hypothetical protein
MQVVAICGAKGAGKDTLANFFTQLGYTHEKLAMPLKQAAMCLFGFSGDQVEIHKEIPDEFWGITPRRVLQWMGTEVMQYGIADIMPNTNRTFFVKSLLRRCEKHDRIVISDMRFMHEYQGISHLNPLVIRVVRPGLDTSDTHVSEQEYTGIPAVDIINDGTVMDLYAAAEKLHSEFRF